MATTYAVILTQPSASAWQIVAERWPNDFLYLTDQIAFVCARDITTTHDIAKALGMNQDGQVDGFVLNAELIAGWTDGRLAEWLVNIRE